MLLQIITDAPVQTTLTLLNGTTATGYSLLEGADWGNAVWEHQYSGPRGTQGARPAQGVPQNRPVVLPIRVAGSSKDNLASLLSTLFSTGEELRRFGGKIKWKSNSETFAQYFQVMTGAAGVSEWGNRAENTYRATVLIQAACAPYLLGDPMDIADDFSTDTITAGDYTFDTGGATLSVTGGQLVPSSTAEKRLYHASRGYTYADAQATVKVTTGASVGALNTGVILKRLDASNYVVGRVNGADNTIKIGKVVAGSLTTLASAAVTAPAASTTYWVRFRAESNVLTAEWWTTEPTPAGTAATSVSYVLTGADATQFGDGIAGNTGLRLIPTGTDERYDDFRVEPYTYTSRTLPENLHLGGTIPGDAPALADLTVTPSGGSAAPVFALASWAPTPPAHNVVWNGDFEDSTVGTSGWANSETGYLGGGSTITRITTQAKYGTASMNISGTQFQGAAFRIFRRFRKGVTYTGILWVRSSTAVTAVNGQLGNVGATDVGGATSVNLSTTWQQITFTWTPTADQDAAVIQTGQSVAATVVWQVDGVQVYEGTTAPTIGKHSEGAGGSPPFGVLEGEACSTGDLTGWAITASGSGRSGYLLTSASAAAASTGWYVDPNLLVPDDYTFGELMVEVWARVQIDSAATSPKYTLSVRPEAGTSYGTERFTFEYGSTGKLVTAPSSSTAWRFVRLGTLPMLVDRAQPRRWKLWLAYSAAGANTSSVDYLIIVPARGRALSPSGKVLDATYPKFVQSTSETTRIIRSDLSGRTAKPPANPHPDTGLGGSLIELPQGAVRAVVKLSSLSPDDPTSDTTTEQLAHTATVHLAVTPRYQLLRGSS